MRPPTLPRRSQGEIEEEEFEPEDGEELTGAEPRRPGASRKPPGGYWGTNGRVQWKDLKKRGGCKDKGKGKAKGGKKGSGKKGKGKEGKQKGRKGKQKGW